MSKYPAKALPNTYHRIMGATVFFQKAGSSKLTKIGPVATVGINLAPTKVDARSSEKGANDLIAQYTTVRDATVTLTDIQMWSPWLYATLYMGEKTYKTQASASALTFDIEDPAVGDVVELPGINPTVTSVTDGASSSPVAYVVDNDFTFHQASKLIELLDIPAGAAAELAKVTYSLPAVTEADGILDITMMSTSENRGALLIVGMIEGGNPGVPVTIKIPDVGFTPNGDTPVGEVTALNVATVVGKVYNTDPDGMAFITSQKAIL